MLRKPPSLDTAGGSQFDEVVEDKIDLRPADPVAMEVVKEILRLVAALAVPQLLEVAKSVVTLRGLVWQRRKAERAKDLILGLYERLERTRFEYVQKGECEDLLEDVLRRVSEQPDDGRRDTMRRIFLKIIEAPREHVENRLLIRLADELPSEALKALAVLDQKLTKEEREVQIAHHALAVRLCASADETSAILGHLMNENLVRRDALGLGGLITVVGVPGTGDDFMFLLSPMGRRFVEYARG